jgi:hypothetical protein
MSKPIPQGWHVTRTSITSDVWTEILVPFHCNGFGLQSDGGASWKLRTVLQDANSELVVSGSAQEVVFPNQPSGGKYPTRFREGCVLCWAKTTSGTDVVVARWVGNG